MQFDRQVLWSSTWADSLTEHDMLPDKPDIGCPCNGCGVCCVATVCCPGSFALGLVKRWGDRAKGPCRALAKDGDKLVCDVMRRPTDWLNAERGPAVLRKAFGLLIRVGAGCDDAGDEADAMAQSKMDTLLAIYLAVHSLDELQAAAEVIEGRYGQALPRDRQDKPQEIVAPLEPEPSIDVLTTRLPTGSFWR